MRNFRIALSASLAAAISTLGLPATQGPANAAPLNCSPASHCYSTMNTWGTDFQGSYGTWNRAGIDASSTCSQPRFITSEMWTAKGDRSAWVEVGHVGGIVDPPGSDIYCNGYRAFYAKLGTGGTYTEWSIQKLSPDATVTDEFQISRGSEVNHWRVYFNGSLRTTGGVGFWATPIVEGGGEVATPDGSAGQFRMRLLGIAPSGVKEEFPRQAKFVDPALSGSSPGVSRWNWSAP